VSIDQTVGSLAELASKGIIGEQAGTSLRGVLLSLTAPSKAARTEMENLGISVFDAQGKFIGVDGAAKALHDSLSGMSQAQRTAALGTIFGNEQITAAQVLYAGGAKAVQDWTGKVNDAGFASRQAADLMDNLSGDVEQLKGSLETAFIQGGSGATGGLRDLVQGATEAVNAFSALPPIVQESTVAIAGLSGAGLLVAGGLIKAVSTVVEFKKTLKELSIAADGSKTKFGSLLGALGGPWGIAIAAGTVALGYFLKQSADAAAAGE
jgi:TP901 family phage tail tape measure protein